MTAPTADIIYPETDGMPIPDGEFQSPILVRIVTTLEVFFADAPGVRVNGNTLQYYVEGDVNSVFSPDGTSRGW